MDIVHRLAAVIAIPFLIVLGSLFACLRFLLGAFMRIVGWDLAWPPLEVTTTLKTTRTRKSASRVRNRKT